MLHSYRTRLMLAFASVVLIGQFLVALLFLARLPKINAETRIEELRAQTALLAAQSFPNGVLTDLDPQVRETLKNAAALLRGGIVVADGRGKVLYAFGTTDLPVKMKALEMLGEVLTRKEIATAEVISRSGHQVLLGAPVNSPQGVSGVLIVAVPLAELRQSGRTLLPTFAAAVVIAVFLSLAVAAVLARAVSAPVEQLTAATEAMARGDYDQQVTITSRDELGRLGERFNYMAREVARSRQILREFTINVSHDLKTPVAIIRGFAEALVDGVAADKAEQTRAAEAIRREADKMSHMIQALLDLARLESRQIVLARERVNVAELLQAALARFRPIAEAQAQQLSLDLAPDLPDVLGDADYLERAVCNLLDNAVRYTPPGGCIEVRATWQARLPPEARVRPEIHLPSAEQPDVRGWVLISVRDSGPGIPEESLDRLFERFYQVDKSRAKTGSEAGLGLAIVREIVSQHNGRVWAESRPGEGATFTIALPVYIKG